MRARDIISYSRSHGFEVTIPRALRDHCGTAATGGPVIALPAPVQERLDMPHALPVFPLELGHSAQHHYDGVVLGNVPFRTELPDTAEKAFEMVGAVGIEPTTSPV